MNSDVGGQAVISRRFNGPPDSANGGYACGVLARHLDGPAEVTLRRPPPLDHALDLRQAGDGGIAAFDGDELIAEARPSTLDLEIPGPVTFAQAVEAARNYGYFHDHPFATCFVCGPARAEGDGLRIFPGKVEGRKLVASPWTPDASLARSDRVVAPEVVWGALDCTTSFGGELAGPTAVSVLGRLTAALEEPVEIGRRYVAVGWPLGIAGRKWEGGSAIFSDTGELKAFARGLWIELRAASAR